MKADLDAEVLLQVRISNMLHYLTINSDFLCKNKLS